jgi:hypothetical protein
MVSASPAMSEPLFDRRRKFLVVVDKTPECRIAVRFAARRAQHTGGRVTLLCIAQPADFQQWRGVEEIMKDEARQEAEGLIYAAAKTVNELAGIIPELVIAEGRPTETLLELIKSDKDISCSPPARQKRAPDRWWRCSPAASSRYPSPSFRAISPKRRSTCLPEPP